ncbi:hypothetical protein NUM3379_34810 [Kineococcus sp. NUM-3379]
MARPWVRVVTCFASMLSAGALLVWAPWEDHAPPGLELADCDKEPVSWAVTVAATVTPDDPQVAVPDALLIAERGQEQGHSPPAPTATVDVPRCEAFMVDVQVVMPAGTPTGAAGPQGEALPMLSDLQAESQRLRSGAGRLYAHIPEDLYCPENASCGVWNGWSITLEAPTPATFTAKAPITWGDTPGGPLVHHGLLTLDVTPRP